MKLREILSILLAIILLPACQKPPDEPATDPPDPEETFTVDFDLEQIIERGKIRVIIENNSTG